MKDLIDNLEAIPMPCGNPNLLEDNSATRFGAFGFDPREAQRRGAATKRRRKEVRQKFQDLIDDGYPVATIEELQKNIQELMSKGDMQTALALRLLGFGLAGTLEDLSEVIANNEGRLVDKRELDVSINHVNLTDEEADQRILQLLDLAERSRAKAIAGPVATPEGGADDGLGEPG